MRSLSSSGDCNVSFWRRDGSTEGIVVETLVARDERVDSKFSAENQEDMLLIWCVVFGFRFEKYRRNRLFLTLLK